MVTPKEQPSDERYLDEIQDEQYRRSPLFGSRWVDSQAAIPIQTCGSVPISTSLLSSPPTPSLSLDGDWLVKPCIAAQDISNLNLHDTSITGGEPDAPGVVIADPGWEYQDPASEGLRSGWFTKGFDRSDWYSLPVPSTIQAGLVESGELPDPFWDTNTYDELSEHGKPTNYPWNLRRTRIEQSEWWLARSFRLPPEWRGKRLILQFDGVDYEASFYLNGQPIAHHVGMFGGPDIEVTNLLEFDADNELVVRVFPPPSNWYGVIKGNPGWGWHYGHLISMGIWRSVRLKPVSDAEIRALFVSTSELGEDSATLHVQWDIESRVVGPVNLQAAIHFGFADGRQMDYLAEIVATPGTTRWSTSIPVSEPGVWWPLGYGNQPLNTVRIDLLEMGNNVSVGSYTETVFGIRTIEMAPATGATSGQYRWQFVVNGMPIFIKGANWCWADPMLRPGDTDHMLSLAASAGIQMLRAWGGGIIESEEFYQQCDRLGILVLQEFPLSWGPPDSPGTDLAVVDDQVKRVVEALRNHPSLIMWGGGNENAASTGADEPLLLIGKRLRQLDPTRPFHRSEPWGGSAHNYEVYHKGLPIDSGYRSVSAVFYGEYGLPSMPARSSIDRFLPPEAISQWPPTPESHGVLAHLHQFVLLDLVKNLRYTRYGPIRSWDDYISYSQFAQGDALRFAAERQRAGSVNGDKTGFWFYKLTDLFPGHSWGILDYYGSPKQSYFRAKQVCRPRDVFAIYDRFNWDSGEMFHADAFLANDTMQPLDATRVVARVYDAQLSLVGEQVFDVGPVEPNQTVYLGAAEFPVPESARPFLLALHNVQDPSFDSWYWFNFAMTSPEIDHFESIRVRMSEFPQDVVPGAAPSPTSGSETGLTPRMVLSAFDIYAQDHGAPLLELPRTQIAVTLLSNVIQLKNVGTVPAFNVCIHADSEDREVIPSDSAFCLSPGQERLITFREVPATVSVTSWNADSVRI